MLNFSFNLILIIFKAVPLIKAHEKVEGEYIIVMHETVRQSTEMMIKCSFLPNIKPTPDMQYFEISEKFYGIMGTFDDRFSFFKFFKSVLQNLLFRFYKSN